MHNHPGGLYAAAGPYLRAALGVNWRGRTVVVSYRGRQVAVVLADWCACGASHTIDLYGDAMMILEPRFRSLGVIPVKISW